MAAICAPWVGLTCGLLAWFLTAWKRSGEITVASTGDTTNAVAGNVTSFGVGWLVSVGLSFAFPAKYTSTDARHIERANRIQGLVSPQAMSFVDDSARASREIVAGGEKSSTQQCEPPSSIEPSTLALAGDVPIDSSEASYIPPMDVKAVRKGTIVAIVANVVFILIAVILVPFTLFGTGYIYSRSFFIGWVVVSFIGVWVSMIICVIYPFVESTGALREVGAGILADMKRVLGGRKSAVSSRELAWA